MMVEEDSYLSMDGIDKAEENSEFTLQASTPLARSHATQKHYYSTVSDLKSNLQSNTEKLDSSQLHIDEQLASLAVEAAVAIVINGIHYAVLMASPNQLEYLAIGFLFSEGLIEHSHELLDCEVTQLTDQVKLEAFRVDSYENTDRADITNSINDSDSIDNLNAFEHLLDYDTYLVELVLNQRCHQRIQAQKRQLAGRTGCGMCGITGLSQALPDLSHYLANKKAKVTIKPSLDTLLTIKAQVDAMQHTHQLTGAVHAAATVYNEQLYLFEDVGRHNALDKLIGWQLRQKAEIDYVVMTSRLSIELIQKSIRIRLPWLVGMSAPTSTAVRVAERYGLGLAGFLRDNRVTYYSKHVEF